MGNIRSIKMAFAENASRADLKRLRQDFDERSTDQFVVLRDAGFQFYFMPNG